MCVGKKLAGILRSGASSACRLAAIFALCCILATAPSLLYLVSPQRAEASGEASAAANGNILTSDEATVWYLAEGYTGGEFDTWVLVQNPGEVDAEVTLTFQLPPGTSAEPFTLPLPAGTRQSIKLDSLPGLENTDVSTKVTSTKPIVAERAMYFNYNGKPGGHDSIGVKYPAQEWSQAEGYHREALDTWGLVKKTGTANTTVTLDFQLPPGTSAPSYTLDLPAGTRRSVHLDDLPGLENTDVSVKISSPIAVVAERAMYFNYQGKPGGHDSAGVSKPSPNWYLAEGYTGGDFDTWVLVQNPGTENANVTMHFQLPPGSSADPYTFNLPAGTRTSVHLDTLPGLSGTDVSTWVDADKPVVAERAMYFNYEGKSGGHCSLGALYEPPVIPETTKVLSQEEINLLDGVEDVGDKRVITFTGGNATLQELEAGDVILSDSPDAPQGFLYKIVSVNRGGGKTILTVTSTGLEEAIWRGNISLAGAVAATSGAGNSSSDAFNAASLLHFDKTLNVNQRIGTASNYVQLTGSLGISADLDFSIDIDYTPPSVSWTIKYKWGIPYIVPTDVTPPSAEVKSVAFGASFTQQASIDLAVHGDLSVDEFVMTVPGTKIDLPRIKFMAGPVPVWLTPYIQAAVGADGEIHMGITAGVTQTATISAGCSYNSASGWSTNKNLSNHFEIRPPTPTGTISHSDFTLSCGPQVGILLYDVVGPYINLMPGERVTLDPNPANASYPLWAVYASLVGDIGVKFGIEVGIYKWTWTLWLVNVHYRVFEWNLLLAKKVWLYSIVPSAGAVGSEVTLNGVNFGDSRENDSFVSFGNTPATEYTAWSDSQIKCKVPQGVSGTVGVTVTHIFHDWNILGNHIRISDTSNAMPFTATGGGGGGTVGELLGNGDFSQGLSGWTIWDQGGSSYHGTNLVEIVDPTSTAYAHFYRRCPEKDGGAAGIIQDLSAQPAGGLRLSARIRCDYQRGGAIAGSNPAWYPEGAVIFRIYYVKSDGSTGEWYHGFYYGDVPGADTAHFTQVPQGSWYDYLSPNILDEIGTDVSITQFRAYGFGWDFDGFVDNLSLRAGP
jgi:hypothetical protein